MSLQILIWDYVSLKKNTWDYGSILVIFYSVSAISFATVVFEDDLMVRPIGPLKYILTYKFIVLFIN